MKKPIPSISLAICLLLFNFCTQTKKDSIIGKADFDAISNTLKVDYTNNPDTSLLQIIHLSNIRKSGYGLLINIGNVYSKSELDALKLKFQKLDINAIHSYDISLQDTLKRKTSVAMKGAKFVWLLGNSKNEWKSKPIGQIISNFQKTEEDKVLVVLN